METGKEGNYEGRYEKAVSHVSNERFSPELPNDRRPSEEYYRSTWIPNPFGGRKRKEGDFPNQRSHRQL
jgi:hypothetical protein